ncbi:MAG: dTMP kinase [Myxococcota bacterium]|nr:dTMP kinase [Myxococcota bacterium]
MFIVFEGIDGSGKTTLAGKVAEALGSAGVSVYEARPKGALRSRLASEIRELARDPRGLDMSARTELMLFLARDAQMIDTVIRGALHRADVVFADRYLYSAMTLCLARGELALKDVRAAAEIVASGLWPDLVVYCDVDIFTSNARKRIERMEHPRPPWDFGRKGLAGLGLRRAMREVYLELAQADPARWFVVDNSKGTVEENASLIVHRVLASLGRATPLPCRPTAPTSAAPRTALRFSGDPGSEDETRRAFYDALSNLALRGQPRLALYHCRSLDSQEAWTLRDNFKDEHPALVALGLLPLGQDRAVAMRHALADIVPQQVARSLGAWSDADPRGFELRRKLASKAPDDVAMTLSRIDSGEAWDLRKQLEDEAPGAVLASLKTLGSPRAWEWRQRLGKKKNDWGLLEGLAGLDDERAWNMRRKFFERAAPFVILGLQGCESEEAWQLRRELFPLAPKLVLSSLSGSSSDEAWKMRQEAGKMCREALTSIKNDASERAFELRQALAPIWPCFAAQSLGLELSVEKAGDAFLRSLVNDNPGDLEVAHYYIKALQARAGRA